MGDIAFKVIFVAENSNKFQKTWFWKEKSVEDVVTLEVEGIVMCLWWCWKDIAMGYKYTLQNNVICCVHPTL